MSHRLLAVFGYQVTSSKHSGYTTTLPPPCPALLDLTVTRDHSPVPHFVKGLSRLGGRGHTRSWVRFPFFNVDVSRPQTTTRAGPGGGGAASRPPSCRRTRTATAPLYLRTHLRYATGRSSSWGIGAALPWCCWSPCPSVISKGPLCFQSLK